MRPHPRVCSGPIPTQARASATGGFEHWPTKVRVTECCFVECLVTWAPSRPVPVEAVLGPSRRVVALCEFGPGAGDLVILVPRATWARLGNESLGRWDCECPVARVRGSTLVGLASSLPGGPRRWPPAGGLLLVCIRPESPSLPSYDILVVSCLGKCIRVS